MKWILAFTTLFLMVVGATGVAVVISCNMQMAEIWQSGMFIYPEHAARFDRLSFISGITQGLTVLSIGSAIGTAVTGVVCAIKKW